MLAKGPEYQIVRRWLGNGLLTRQKNANSDCMAVTFSEGQKWRERRKLLTPGFHFAILGSAMSAIEQQAKAIIN